MEKVGTFFGHLEYIKVTLYIYWPFGNLVAIRYISPRFGTLCQEKSGNPAGQAFRTLNIFVDFFVCYIFTMLIPRRNSFSDVVPFFPLPKILQVIVDTIPICSSPTGDRNTRPT
jgi:hypothetical protein